MLHKKVYLDPPKILVLGFGLIIVIGAFLLTLPASTANGQGLPFLNALFTATSATCVTGLVVVDTGTTFTMFGQITILCMIQVGGLGIYDVCYVLCLLSWEKNFFKRKDFTSRITK